MTIRGINLLAAVLVACAALNVPASAEPTKPAKPKKPANATAMSQPQMAYRGQDRFRAGPLYFQDKYLGDDPDPFIRSQIQRDLGARFPGSD